MTNVHVEVFRCRWSKKSKIKSLNDSLNIRKSKRVGIRGLQGGSGEIRGGSGEIQRIQGGSGMSAFGISRPKISSQDGPLSYSSDFKESSSSKFEKKLEEY